MKKLMVGWLAAALAGVMCFSLAGCGKNGYSETFKGAVSEATYESAESAVKGFLKEEVSGLTVQAEYVGYEKEAELSQKEIDDLPLGEYAEGLLSAEKGQVEYRETTEEGAALVSADTDGTVKRAVYILTYADVFRFFAPPVNTGETLTAKYYDSVLQADKYSNCTMRVVFKTGEEKVQVAVSYLFRLTETALYEEGYPSEDFSGGRIVSYGLEKDGSIKWYRQTVQGEPFYYDDSTYGATVAGLTVKNFFGDCFLNIFFGELDHTYYKKTETGFALCTDKYAAWLGTTEESIKDSGYVYNIEDGKIVGVHVKGVVGSVWTTVDIELSDFGTTKVTVPDEVKALAAQ